MTSVTFRSATCLMLFRLALGLSLLTVISVVRAEAEQSLPDWIPRQGATPPAATQQDDVAAINKRIRDLFRKGDYDAASREAQKLEAVGPNGITRTLDVAETLHDLARGLSSQGKHVEAEKLLNRALIIRAAALDWLNLKRAELYPLGPRVEDSMRDVATILSLADVYRLQGKQAEAEKALNRAVEIGEFFSAVRQEAAAAETLNGVAAVYRGQGRTREAERLEKRARQICGQSSRC